VWLEALAAHGEVTLIAPGPLAPAGAPAHRRVQLAPAWPAIPWRALRVVRRGWPLTVLLAAGAAWRRAFTRAAGGGPYDVSVVVLARTHPWVAPYLTGSRRVLDAIDALSANLQERARAACGPWRTFWRREAARTARLEEEVVRRYQRVVVVAEEERRHFRGVVEVASHGVEVHPEGAAPRDVDFAFWGRLAYFANRDAVLTLLRDLWPAIRARLPRARLVLAGADCPRAVRAFDGRDGVCVVSPLGDRPALLRRVRVALFPVRFGSGQPNKVLEAAEASCAIVSTPAGARGVGPLATAVVVAPLGGELVDAAVALASDAARCTALGAQGRRLVAAHFDRREARVRFAEIAGLAP
jgi:glycosyltransferase involved in cell wall biosynthesis